MDDTTDMIWQRILTDGVFFVTDDDAIGRDVKEAVKRNAGRDPFFVKEDVDVLEHYVFTTVSTP
jgi:hypothetical protein